MGLLPQVNAQDVLALHCPLCAFHSHWLNLLEAHFSRHHGARSAEFRLYQCSKCHKIASSKAFLSEHLVLHHRSGGKAKTTRWSRLDSLDARPGCRDNGHYEADSPPGDVVRRAESVNQPLADATETSGLERLASKSPDNEPGYIITFFRGHLCAHAPRPTESSTESRRDGPPGTTDIDATEANDRPVHLETTAACRHCSPGRRAHNRFAGLGLRHQCLFCPFTSAQPARLARHYVEHGIRRLQFFTAPSADATDRPKTNGGPASMKAPEADEAEEECPQASVAEAGKGETTDAGPDPDGDRAEDDEVDDNQVVKAAGGETKKPVSEGLLDDNGQMNYAKSSPDSADLKKRCEAMPSMLLPDHRGRRQVESRMKGRPITRSSRRQQFVEEPKVALKDSELTSRLTDGNRDEEEDEDVGDEDEDGDDDENADDDDEELDEQHDHEQQQDKEQASVDNVEEADKEAEKRLKKSMSRQQGRRNRKRRGKRQLLEQAIHRNLIGVTSSPLAAVHELSEVNFNFPDTLILHCLCCKS